MARKTGTGAAPPGRAASESAGRTPDSAAVKSCCAAVYQSDWARFLLGGSFHPGGPALTELLGQQLGLTQGMRVLDVACGTGASANFLAQRVGCAVVGVDYSADSVRAASQAAAAAGISSLVSFERGDAERLSVPDAAFDAVICECAFCTFPDKLVAAAELARVLRPGGQIGLTDLTRSGEVPPELQGLLAWVACIADAQPIDGYRRILEAVGLAVDLVEPHDDALAALVQDVCTRLLGAELLVKLKRIDLPGADFDQARALARVAAESVKAGRLGYTLVVATKPAAEAMSAPGSFN